MYENINCVRETKKFTHRFKDLYFVLYHVYYFPSGFPNLLIISIPEEMTFGFDSIEVGESGPDFDNRNKGTERIILII